MELLLKLLRELMGKGYVVMDKPILDEGRLVIGNDVGEDNGERGCHDFGDDFERKVEQTYGSEVMEIGEALTLGNQS